MRTTPSRRTTLQFLQIFLTEALTFILFSLCLRDPPVLEDPVALIPFLSHPVRYSAAGQVVRRKFHCDLVAGQDFYVVHPHFARNMGQHLVPVFERYPEHRIGKGFLHGALYFYRVAFRHYRVRLKFPVRWR